LKIILKEKKKNEKTSKVMIEDCFGVETNLDDNNEDNKTNDNTDGKIPYLFPQNKNIIHDFISQSYTSLIRTFGKGFFYDPKSVVYHPVSNYLSILVNNPLCFSSPDEHPNDDDKEEGEKVDRSGDDNNSDKSYYGNEHIKPPYLYIFDPFTYTFEVTEVKKEIVQNLSMTTTMNSPSFLSSFSTSPIPPLPMSGSLTHPVSPFLPSRNSLDSFSSVKSLYAQSLRLCSMDISDAVYGNPPSYICPASVPMEEIPTDPNANNRTLSLDFNKSSLSPGPSKTFCTPFSLSPNSFALCGSYSCWKGKDIKSKNKNMKMFISCTVSLINISSSQMLFKDLISSSSFTIPQGAITPSFDFIILSSNKETHHLLYLRRVKHKIIIPKFVSKKKHLHHNNY
jgi:hypothetical protein